MEDTKKILEKIQKLKALQESAEKLGSIEEAANAAAQTQRLLVKYNLSLEEVDAHIPEKEVSHESFCCSYETKKSESTWVISLYHQISRFNFCSVIAINKYKIHLVGEKYNREVVKDLCESLIPRIRNLEKESWRTYSGLEKRGTFRRGFLVGVVKGIMMKLEYEMFRLKEEEPKLDGLILVKTESVKKYINDNFYTKNGKSHRLSSQSGKSMGIEAGKNMSINRGIAGKGSIKQLGNG